MTAANVDTITGYYAHIYYDDASRADAAWVREELRRRFDVNLGRWREHPVGPRPQAMSQVAFGANEFPQIVPWLMLNRRGLTVLVHPATGDGMADHDVYPLWLGQKLDLDVEFLRRFAQGEVSA